MNKFIYLFAMILSLSLWSCGKDDDGVEDPNNPNNPGNPDNVTLELSTKDLVFEAQGGELTFDITCNADWTITNESDWCTLDMTSGKGDATITVTTEAYYENEDQNTVLTIKAGNKTETLTVTQKDGEALILSKDKFDVPQKGGNITIELQSNVTCEISIPYEFNSWIHESPQAKELETTTYDIIIDENPDYTPRDGYVLISSSEIEDTVHIHQATYDGDVIVLETNDDIKSFAAQKLTTLSGSLIVTGEEITTLSALDNQLQEISGHLIIDCPNFSNFDGLYNLKKLGGDLKLIADEESMNELSSFEGLNNLESIGGNFEINAGNPSSIRKDALKTLASFKGLENLVSIGGNFTIYAMDGLNNLRSFEGLENLASIGGNFEINSFPYVLSTLTSFKGLENLASISGDFEIDGGNFTFFEGLGNLASIGGNFKVGGLTSFKGLDKLKQIDGNFNIASSSSLEGLENLVNIGGDFTNDKYSPVKVENHLSDLSTVGGNMEIWIETYDSPKTFDANFSSLESVGGSLSLGNFYINTNNYGTLSLPLLQAIGGECSFSSFDLIDFPNLESINGALKISRVNSIVTLDKLKSVGDITISDCHYLYDFCNWIPLLTDYNGTFLVTNCGYNPTKYQILNGECSQTPAN